MSQPFAQVFPNVNAINWAKKEFQKGIPKFQQTRKKLKRIKERERERERRKGNGEGDQQQHEEWQEVLTEGPAAHNAT